MFVFDNYYDNGDDDQISEKIWGIGKSRCGESNDDSTPGFTRQVALSHQITVMNF